MATQRQKQIKLADDWFSRFIRLHYADDNGNGRCVSCGRFGQVKFMDCGHYHSRKYLSIRWDEMNAALQCKKCNLSMGDPTVNKSYESYMIRRHGVTVLATLEVKKFNRAKLTPFEINFVANHYRKKANDLCAKKKITPWW